MTAALALLAQNLGDMLSSANGFIRCGEYRKQLVSVDFSVKAQRAAFDIVPEFDGNVINAYSILAFSRQGTIESNSISLSDDLSCKYVIKRVEVTSNLTVELAETILGTVQRLRSGIFEKRDATVRTRVINYATQEARAPLNLQDIEQKNQSDFSIKDVLARDMCIGCGACAIATAGAVSIEVSDDGMYVASAKNVGSLTGELYNRADEVCPFSDASPNEDDLGPPLSNTLNMPSDFNLGYYRSLIAGRVADGPSLNKSSSGGMTSWLLKRLISSGRVDGVIHVGNSTSDHRIFEYRISFSIQEIDSNRKSFYYSTTLANVMAELSLYRGKKFAIVGVPCFIKAARTLVRHNAELKDSLKYFIGIVCGHMKSSFFAEASAWQLGVAPDDIDTVDFRVKEAGRPSNEYRFSVTSKLSNEVTSQKVAKLLGGNWGHAFFQPNACNFCDDVFAETSDIVFGDAWLQKYHQDGRGTNIAVIRNIELASVVQSGIDDGELDIDNITLEDMVRSQAGGLRHRRSGLKIRLADEIASGFKVPKKRVLPLIDSSEAVRADLVRRRKHISLQSFETFRDAKKTGDISDFLNPMRKEVAVYRFLDSHKYPPVKKTKMYDVALFGWHHQANLGGVLTVFALHELLRLVGLSVVVVWKPSQSAVNSSNDYNYKITSQFYKYAKFRDLEKLHELRKYCDNFVLASDQLWAGKWISFTPEYEFLASGDQSVKRISVSTSFGGDGTKLPFSGDNAAVVSHLLNSFDHVSVRERDGVEILKSIGVEGTQILDPVFLCPPSIYSTLMSKADKSFGEEPFIMSYILDAQPEIVDFAQDMIPSKVGCKDILFMTTMKGPSSQTDQINFWHDKVGDRFLPFSSFADLVYNISRSEYVFTDSFHGACLAVIFNKPFICCPKSSRGKSRFQLFEQLGLKNRITSRDRLAEESLMEPIDWLSVNQKLGVMREHSFKWLSNAFGVNFAVVSDGF